MIDDAVKIKLDAGFWKNGTEYQAAGRWLDGDLVRWHNESIKPIGGWQPKLDLLTQEPMEPLWTLSGEAARSGIAVGDTIGGTNTYIGTNKAIYQISNSNAVSNVTPTGFVAKGQQAASNVGFGSGRYGAGKYGAPRSGAGAQVPMVFSWGFTEWGEWPVAVARGDATLNVLKKEPTDADFVEIANAPAGAYDVIVTDERIMMTFGSPTDGKLISWSDQEDFDTWTPAIDNQAGFLRVSGAGRLVRAVKVLNQILVLGDSDAFTGQFVGPPYVYGFDRAGDKCGVIGPEAVVVTATFAAWLGKLSFWIYDGVVRQLYCDVLDFVLDNIDDTQRSKTMAFTIADFSECWWIYQSKFSTTGEPDSYVIYNYAKNCWYTGTLDRTVGLDRAPIKNVTMVGSDGIVYDHEIVSANTGGRVPFIESGPLELANGKRLLGVSYVYPDERLTGSVRMEMQVRGMPNYPNRTKSPVQYARDFELAHPTSTHGIMGRDIRMKLYGAQLDPAWTIGDFRVIPFVSGSPIR